MTEEEKIEKRRVSEVIKKAEEMMDKGMISAVDKVYPASTSTTSEPFGKHIISIDEYLSYLNV